MERELGAIGLGAGRRWLGSGAGEWDFRKKDLRDGSEIVLNPGCARCGPSEDGRYVTVPGAGLARHGGDHGSFGGEESGRAPVREPDHG